MNVQRIAAFSDGEIGGNPAGVVIADTLPSPAEMQAVAADVGYSETVFAAPAEGGWRARYFAPEIEVPFCGHATIALGAALALKHGDGVFELTLNESGITVEGRREGATLRSALQSPATRSAPATRDLVDVAVALFGFTSDNLDPRIPPAVADAGARFLVLALSDRPTLASMHYDFQAGKTLMERHRLTTISLVYAENAQLFHARNAFAAGGVYEDPATGAAAAAFGGYLRDLSWPHAGSIQIIQGEDMGMRSRIAVNISQEPGASIRVSGSARLMDAASCAL